MTITQRLSKRVFDILFSLFGLILFTPIILISWLIASVDTKSNGFFLQKRIGRYGKLIKIVKIKTMYDPVNSRSPITAISSSEISTSGAFFRKTKIDELPQLFNVFIGNMSFVGPRPDVPGYADLLEGQDRIILQLRPGITGPASIKYKNEDYLLSKQPNPQKFNDEVIWPDKVLLNKYYFENYSFFIDIKYIIKTILG